MRNQTHPVVTLWRSRVTTSATTLRGLVRAVRKWRATSPALLSSVVVAEQCWTARRQLRAIADSRPDLTNDQRSQLLNYNTNTDYIAREFGPEAATLARAARWTNYSYRVTRAERWSQAERDLRRARNDGAFRRRYLAAPRRILREMSRPVSADASLAEITRRVDLLNSGQQHAAITAIRAVLPRAKPIRWVPVQDMPGHTLQARPETARKLGAEVNMSGKAARILPTKGSSRRVHSPGETTWRHGRPISYTRATNDNYVRAFAVIRDEHNLDVALHDREFRLTLPDGYLWGTDDNGIRAVRADSRRDDYHPTAEDCLAGADAIVRALEHNRETRIRISAERAAEAAEVEGVFVCAADSVRAGNCLAGTRTFAERHHLDVRFHYRAPELLTIANGDAGRVRLAVKAAVARHREEMRRGYANLADHAL